MKKISLIFGILIVLDIIYFSFVNYGQIIPLNYKPLIDTIQLDAGLSFLAMCAYGALGALLIMNYFVIGLKERLQKQARNTEKANVVSEESSDKVKLLEAKIQTLEVALKECLEKK